MTIKLMVVIHTEEEFDWDGGFYPTNTQISHDKELGDFVAQLLDIGGRVALAMDYPFVNSEQGGQVIQRFKAHEGVEFATHLHPWVNPPLVEAQAPVDSYLSYPGNLPTQSERDKLQVLTALIADKVGVAPQTYLAGRYGLGEHTASHLQALGYTLDLSISAYCDFSHQQGPDFSGYTNQPFFQNGLNFIPHTSAILASIPFIERRFNRHPRWFTRMRSTLLSRVIGKVLRIRRHRLSPEGFTLAQLQRVTHAQLAVGQQIFVLSLHSPSVKPGLTSYAQDEQACEQLKQTTLAYVRWFYEQLGGQCVLPQQAISVK